MPEYLNKQSQVTYVGTISFDKQSVHLTPKSDILYSPITVTNKQLIREFDPVPIQTLKISKRLLI